MNYTPFPRVAKLLLAGIMLSLGLHPAGSCLAQQENKVPDAEVYEAIGLILADRTSIGRMQFTDEQIELIISGIRKGVKLGEIPAGVEALEPKIEAIMREKMQLARNAEQEAQEKLAETNRAKGEAFLAKISQQAGVLKDPSGFYYVILKKGTGASPTMDDTVRLHYHGTLIDGTVFDSSVDRGQPTSFPMNGVIKGFSGGLTKTQVGGKIRIYIPSKLGYGDNPRPGGKIKPGDTLIFECELLEIK